MHEIQVAQRLTSDDLYFNSLTLRRLFVEVDVGVVTRPGKDAQNEDP